MTKEERHLWYDFLRTYRLRFQRQKILGRYIADFYCAEAKLVIELDGSQHCTTKEEIEKDNRRSAFLEEYGLYILRFSNLDVLQNFEGVCQYIDLTIDKLTKQTDQGDSH